MDVDHAKAMDFEDAISELVLKARKAGVDMDTIISALEIVKMSLEEDGD